MGDAVFDLTDRNWSRLQEVLIDALDRPADQRVAFLREAGDSDDAIRREAESLLDAYSRCGDFLEQLDLAMPPMKASLAQRTIGVKPIVQVSGIVSGLKHTLSSHA